jgi:hypothetical protein
LRRASSSWTKAAGGGYVPEQHGEETHSYLPPKENREIGVGAIRNEALKALNIAMLSEVAKALRGALSLR